MVQFIFESTVPRPDIRNRVRTATAIAVHNFRIAVFCYAQRSSSAEETNRVQTAVCLFFTAVLTRFKFLL